MSAKPSTKVRNIAAEVEALSPADKLRLAADLLESKQHDAVRIAQGLANRVAVELGAALALGMVRK